MSIVGYPSDIDGVIDLGERHFLLPGGWDRYLWWHDCPAVAHPSWHWFGYDVEQDIRSGHIIVSHTPVSVQGSLVCTDCGDHGFITDSRWVPLARAARQPT